MLNNCILCKQCTAICPKEAISINGYDTEQIEWNGEDRLNPQKILDIIRFSSGSIQKNKTFCQFAQSNSKAE